MPREHGYGSCISWSGNRGEGTRSYGGYDRTWDIAVPGRATVHCSNDPLLGGDPTRPNPEDLLLSSLAGCHMLWYLHLASSAGIVVTAYEDNPLGIGEVENSGQGRFLRAVLRPRITVVEGTDVTKADEIHHRTHGYCFIARSVRFPVRAEATYVLTRA